MSNEWSPDTPEKRRALDEAIASGKAQVGYFNPLDGKFYPSPSGTRDLEAARETARAALIDYGLMSQYWNAPDGEHTRYMLRTLLDEVIAAVFRDE